MSRSSQDQERGPAEGRGADHYFARGRDACRAEGRSGGESGHKGTRDTRHGDRGNYLDERTRDFSQHVGKLRNFGHPDTRARDSGHPELEGARDLSRRVDQAEVQGLGPRQEGGRGQGRGRGSGGPSMDSTEEADGDKDPFLPHPHQGNPLYS